MKKPHNYEEHFSARYTFLARFIHIHAVATNTRTRSLPGGRLQIPETPAPGLPDRS